MTVTDTGATQVDGWALTFTLPSGQTITSGWNATFSPAGGTVTARNVAYNAVQRPEPPPPSASRPPTPVTPAYRLPSASAATPAGPAERPSAHGVPRRRRQHGRSSPPASGPPPSVGAVRDSPTRRSTDLPASLCRARRLGRHREVDV
ncbi:cellulose binding domain-containing protein [Streptomyces spiralis]|uniref:cellulose binding domain-containing protein n=1 Tax=Streptomyces spiralis TaxID=66376 RepID=UPI0036ACE7F3